MEEENAANRRRSSRSRSKPPMSLQEVADSGLLPNEPVVKLSKFQAIEEMVVQEQRQSTQVITITTEQTFVQTEAVIESQNRQNQNQEYTKALAAKTSEKTTRRSVRAKQTSVNGSPKKVKKSMVAQDPDAIILASVEGSSVSKSTTPRYETPRARQHDRGLARKFYEAVGRGEVDTSQSTFMRFYKPVEEWWNYYPKTDNTYSPLSSCRYELAPGMIAMPNLSRRSIQGVRSSSRRATTSSWFSGVDSDTEDYDERGAHHAQASTMSITTVVKRVSVVTITTVWTVLTILYSYSIGAVVGRFTQGGGARASEADKTPTLLLPVLWLSELVRRFTLLEAWLISKIGSRRNLLLALLLFLLLAVPIYVLYAGDPIEASTQQEQQQGLVARLTGGIYDFLHNVIGFFSGLVASVWEYLVMVLQRTYAFVIDIIYSPISLLSWIFGQSRVETVKEDHINMNSDNDLEPLSAKNNHDVEHLSAKTDFDLELLSAKVLKSDSFTSMLSSLRAELKVPDSHNSLLLHLTKELKELRANLDNLNKESESDKASKQYYFHTLQREIRGLERQVRLIQMHQGQAATSTRCCDKVEAQLAAILAGLVGARGDGDDMAPAEVVTLIKSKLDAMENLEARLTKLTADLKLSQQKASESQKEQADRSSGWHASVDLESLSDERVRAIVREALAVYDADKTNMVDYALETSGGTILSTRCTENYDYKHGVTFYFGFSWLSKEYRPNNPRTIIQPNVHPGECWAFKGATGFVVIELSTRVRVMAVSMEHIPRSLAPYGKIDSAPRDFSVWGLVDLMDPEPLLLGKFRYEDNSHPLQTFQVEMEHDSLQRIELRIESNHGHLEYTCVYRFRVHGVPTLS